MKPLNASELLLVWEHGLNRSMLERSLILLSAASPEMDSDAIAKLSIGERDKRLIKLREWMFGSRFVNTVVCPQCSERVEWENEIEDIRIQSSPAPTSGHQLSLDMENYNVKFRPPNSLDLAEVMDIPEANGTPGDLLKRCVITAEHVGSACSTEQLPDVVLQELARRIEELDPQADVSIQLTCPQCAHRWEVLFDIASYLWAEINSWAERTLRAVHKLARAYGWTEREILNLSPVRRQLYMGMVNL